MTPRMIAPRIPLRFDLLGDATSFPILENLHIFMLDVAIVAVVATKDEGHSAFWIKVLLSAYAKCMRCRGSSFG